jgi:hypothetical protein
MVGEIIILNNGKIIMKFNPLLAGIGKLRLGSHIWIKMNLRYGVYDLGVLVNVPRFETVLKEIWEISAL